MQNQTLIQFFHWYTPADSFLWKHFNKEVSHLAKLGITGAWLPPPYKGGSGAFSVGYDSYDLFDLGEFDQQGTIPTKYGTRHDLVTAIRRAHKKGVQVYIDACFNHKAHGDELEKITVREVKEENRSEFISEPEEVEAWTKFYFPGRNKKYSEFIWDKNCFSGIDWIDSLQKKGIFKILNEYGDQWEPLAEVEYGGYDYLSFCDVEFRNEHVREELKWWGKWILETADVDGFRIDAIKHINPEFIKEWVDHMNSISPKPLFYLGEYWNDQNAESLKNYIELIEGRVQLIDAPLHHNFYRASVAGREYDISKIFENTLIQHHPARTVTFVSNHDSQPLQVLEKPMADWMNPLSYALILLREQGIPCIFYPDLYGAEYSDKGKDGNDHHIILNKVKELPRLLLARKHLAYGMQREYMDHKTTIGWTREGTDDKPNSGLAVLMSTGDAGWKYMEIGQQHAGKTFVDCLSKFRKHITIDEKGGAEFHCKAGSVSVWVEDQAMRTFH